MKTKNITSCNLCGSKKNKIFLNAVKDNVYNIPGIFQMKQCLNCGLVFLSPRPLESEIANLYPEEYGPYHIGKSTKKYVKLKQVLKKLGLLQIARALIDGRSAFIPKLPPGAKILEIGCSNGFFLESLKEHGWNLHGVEINDDAARYAREKRKINVKTDTLESAQFASNYFDCVFAFMLIEHLSDPTHTLREIHRILKPGGYFVFSTINIDCAEFKIFKHKWYPLSIPQHLYFFTPKTLDLYLQKTNMKLEKVFYQRNVKDIGKSIYLVSRESKIRTVRKIGEFFDKLGNRLVLRPITWLLSALKQNGRITCVAKKI